MKYYLAIKMKEVLIHVYYMDDPGKHYSKWKEPDTKENILYDFYLYETSGIGKSRDRIRWVVA